MRARAPRRWADQLWRLRETRGGHTRLASPTEAYLLEKGYDEAAMKKYSPMLQKFMQPKIKLTQRFGEMAIDKFDEEAKAKQIEAEKEATEKNEELKNMDTHAINT